MAEKVEKERLDVLLVQRGLAPGRDQAKAYIMAGNVYVDGMKEDKAGTKIPVSAEIEVRDAAMKYVSRGGYKLEKAMEVFPITLTDKICLDIGASTGGFTDCMLQNGAAKVYSIDVGYGQFAWKLRNDPRVVCLEKTNVRYVTQEQVPDAADFASIDVSFISLTKVLPAVLGVMKEDMVNIIVHGHDPSLSEMICEVADSPEMVAYAKEMGAKGITISGVCCTSNEVAMRRGIPMAGNFLQQENVVLTGACEAIVVDVQCIFPALGPLSKCFHTKFITTSPIAQMPDSEFIRFDAHSALEKATQIVKLAIENFKNRKPELVYIPQMKQKATVGFSTEAIVKALDGVANTQVDELGTTKPLLQCITSGVLRGAVAMVGCNNPKVRPDLAHIELMKKMLANDIIVIASGCSAQAAAKAGLMDKAAKDVCGDGLKRVCELADIPPVLHMGSCVDISRMLVLAATLAKDAGLHISQLPVVGCAPEWMSEKAVSIGNYVIGSGIDTFLGVDPYASGSSEMVEILTNGTRQWCEAAFTVEKDIDKLGDAMMARIEEKRAALGI